MNFFKLLFIMTVFAAAVRAKPMPQGFPFPKPFTDIISMADALFSGSNSPFNPANYFNPAKLASSGLPFNPTSLGGAGTPFNPASLSGTGTPFNPASLSGTGTPINPASLGEANTPSNPASIGDTPFGPSSFFG